MKNHQTRKPVYAFITLVCLFCCIVTVSPLLAKKGKPTVTSEEEEAGNNLSVPVIWSEGEGSGLTLQGDPENPIFDGASVLIDGVDWYPQKDENNKWQAEAVNGSTDGTVVSQIDWGDNLEAKNWTEKSIVRVETVLYKSLTEPMTGYTMQHLSGQGIDEVWGTNTETYESNEATVYSTCANLTIQKLTTEPETAALSWNSAVDQWTGDVTDDIVFKGGIWQGSEGPGWYSAEVNVAGKVIYGYNWNLRTTGQGPGHYRITFSLSTNAAALPLASFDGTTTILGGEEEDDSSPGGGIAVIDTVNNLTYIDVYIEAKSQGGGNGGGQGNKGGSR